MRFKSIEFKNYRCFLDGRLHFDEDSGTDCNINLILGSNGCGKTELLFAFTWALWGYDFKRQKGKEETPYALNSRLHHALVEGSVGGADSCSVDLEFEDGGTEYRVGHTVHYRKQGSRVESADVFSLSWRDEYGEFTVPLHDRREIDPILNRIMPKATLEGLSFDGERMQRLSQVNDDSQATIKSVIQQVTRTEFFNTAQKLFQALEREVVRTISKRSARYRATDLTDTGSLQIDLEECQSEVERHQVNEKAVSEALERLRGEYARIAEALEEADAAREQMGEKRALEKQLDSIDKRLVEESSNFRDLMGGSGYLLASGRLLEEVEGVLEDVDVPSGLTAIAVQSILDGDRCICGEPLDDVHRAKLKALVDVLPPASINATIKECVRIVGAGRETKNQELKRCMKTIRDAEHERKRVSQDIDAIDRKLAGIDTDGVKRLHQKGVELSAQLRQHETELADEREKLNAAQKRLRDLRLKIDTLTSANDDLRAYRAQRDFLTRAAQAISIIRTRQEREALAQINENVRHAYELVSEDAARGRSLWLVCFNKQRKYQMVSYYQDRAERELSQKGLTWDDASAEERERAVLACGEASSTGQSKINTFAFVRAVLDYANTKKDDGTFEVERSYPLLIDAPFGDVFDGNLFKSSSELHNFAHQVIMMLAGQSYETVRPQIEPFVSKTFELRRDDELGATTITEVI